MSKVTFVYPDHESLGIQILMSLVKQHGHTAQLVLYNTGDNFHSDPIKNPGDLFSRIFEKKSPEEVRHREIAEKIIQTKPDLIAFSCVTDNFEHQLRIASACKQIQPAASTILGGIHVTSLPEHVIQCPEVDAVAIGESEISFIEFLTEGSRNGTFSLPERPIKGIVFKRGGQLVGDFSEGDLIDLDTLPFPKKSLWRSHRGLEYMRTDYKTMASRGCPYRCSYCCNDMLHALRGKSLIRRRSVANVIEELCYAKNKNRDLCSVHFWDDCFTSDKQWLKNFAVEYKTKIALPFQCLAIPQTCDSEIVNILADMGCVGVQLGVQSLSPSLNKNILFRSFDLDKITASIQAFQNAGIKVFADQILGIPEDTIRDQEKAILFYNKIRPFRIHALWLTFYPKTKITSLALEKNLLTQERYREIVSGKNCGSDLLVSSSHVKGELKKYIPISFLLKYIPVLPKWFVSFLVYTKIYRLFVVRNYAVATLLPDYVKTVGGWWPFWKLCFSDRAAYFKNKSGEKNIKKGILIMEATYGSNCARENMSATIKGNSTQILSSKCNGRKKIKFKVDVHELGDPAPGQEKDLSIIWRFAEDPNMAPQYIYVAAEAHGKTVQIPSLGMQVERDDQCVIGSKK